MDSPLDFGSWTLEALLPEPVVKRLEMASTRITYKNGAQIHARGDLKPGLSMIKTGTVRFGGYDQHGNYIETSVLGAGHCFGEATLFAGLPRAYDAVADGETHIDQLSKTKFDAIMESEPSLAPALLSAMTSRLYSTLEFMDDLRRLPLDINTAKVLLNMANTSDKSWEVECNQSDLAYTLGVSRVSIGKVLSGLQDKKYIKLGYGRIKIIEPGLLQQWVADNLPLSPLRER